MKLATALVVALIFCSCSDPGANGATAIQYYFQYGTNGSDDTAGILGGSIDYGTCDAWTMDACMLVAPFMSHRRGVNDEKLRELQDLFTYELRTIYEADSTHSEDCGTDCSFERVLVDTVYHTGTYCLNRQNAPETLQMIEHMKSTFEWCLESTECLYPEESETRPCPTN